MRLGLSLLGLLSLAGCTRPSLLVCREVTEAGVCRQPTTELDVGHGYTLFATGFGLPEGPVEIRLHETVGGTERRIATAEGHIASGQRFLTHSLVLPHVGSYRVELVDGEGDVFRSLSIRAPRPTFRVSTRPVPTARIPIAPPATP